jgi:hypothetical protein
MAKSRSDTASSQDGVARAFGVHDRQHALHEIELQAMHIGHAAQLLADQRFLGRAVHLADAQARQHLPRAGAQGRPVGGQPRMAAVVMVMAVMIVAVMIVAVMIVAMMVMVMGIMAGMRAVIGRTLRAATAGQRKDVV